MNIIVLKQETPNVVVLSESTRKIVQQGNILQTNSHSSEADIKGKTIKFNQSMLNNGILNLTLDWTPEHCSLYDNNGEEFMPDALSMNGLNLIVNLSSFMPIMGEYEVRVD